MKLYYLILILFLIIPSTALVASNQFNITMDNSRSIYYIDYGAYNITLLNYTLNSSSNLGAVQDWSMYGAATGEYWIVQDVQYNQTFVANVENLYTPITSSTVRYYGFVVLEGFYEVGDTIALTLTTNQTGAVPATPVMGKNVIPASSASVSGLNYPIIILVVGGIGVVGILGLMVIKE